jgi:hypothetical protein
MQLEAIRNSNVLFKLMMPKKVAFHLYCLTISSYIPVPSIRAGPQVNERTGQKPHIPCLIHCAAYKVHNSRLHSCRAIC